MSYVQFGRLASIDFPGYRSRFLLSLFFLGIIGSISAAHAQIVYTDIPDTTIAATAAEGFREYDLDLNGDGEMDFYFKHFNFDGDVEVEAYCYDIAARILIDPADVPYALQAGEQIGPERSTWWNTFSGIANSALFLNANWAGLGDRFVGLRFQKEGATYYGWLQMSVPEDGASFTVKGFAYNATPGAPIIAGVTSGVETSHDDPADGLTLSMSGGELRLKLDPARVSGGEVRLYNSLGEEMIGHPLSAGEASLDLASLRHGIYFLLLSTDTRTTVRQVAL